MSFRHAFTPARSREPKLDPSRAAGCSPASLEGPRAARRLLQTKRAREHDRRTVRTLPTPREVALAWSSNGRWLRFSRAVFPRHAMRGQPSLSRARGRMRLAPRRGSFGGDRSRSEALPQPDRPGHPLSLARGDAGWWCRLRQALIRAPRYVLADELRGDRVVRTRAASRVPPRRGARSAAPKVPSIEGSPSSESCGSSTTCPQFVEYSLAPLQLRAHADPDGIRARREARPRDASPALRARPASA